MGDRGWWKISRDRDAWKLILKDAKFLDGSYNKWRCEEKE